MAGEGAAVLRCRTVLLAEACHVVDLERQFGDEVAHEVNVLLPYDGVGKTPYLGPDQDEGKPDKTAV